MAEYTYKDVIIDPTSEEARNCIGKVVYSADNPTVCLDFANNHNASSCGILDRIKDGYFPFVLRGNIETSWESIILRKEVKND